MSLASLACGNSATAGTEKASEPAAGRPVDVCALVSAEEVGRILGENVTTAKPAEPGALDEKGVAAPGCAYRGVQGFAVVYALPLSAWKGHRDGTIPMASTPVPDVGEEAFLRREAPESPSPEKLVLEIGARKGSRNIHARIFRGTTEAQAKALVTAFLP